MCPKYLKHGTKCNNSLPKQSGEKVETNLERSRGGKTIQTDLSAFKTMPISMLCCATVQQCLADVANHAKMEL